MDRPSGNRTKDLGVSSRTDLPTDLHKQEETNSELIDVAFITLRNNLAALLETLYTGISFLDSRRSVFFHQ